MRLEIKWPAKFSLRRLQEMHYFLQQMANRLAVGEVRYGPPDRRKKYMTRIGLEYKAYKKTGNSECLRNIANYCVLEDLEPENAKHHFDGHVDSVTRGKV